MSTILQGIGDAITGVASWVVSLIQDIVDIFYDTSGTTPQFTFLGVLLLVAFGLSMVWVVIKFIRSMVRRG